MTTTAARDDRDTLLGSLQAWLAEHWDPDLTLAQWWERLGTSGWAVPTLPEAAFGRGLSMGEGMAVQREIDAAGAVGAPAGLGPLLAAPTIATHGSPEQVERYVRDIVTGQRAWCQLFSEPGAGSDLAGLSTRAVRDGDEWVVTGQKVWTSMGQMADLGMLLARTDPDVPKHEGITWFAIEMDQPGIEVRPLREMTGHAMFNEVFLTEARVPVSAVVGGVHKGWAVANTTLAFERAGLGAGSRRPIGLAPAGQKAGQLGRRAGDFVPAVHKKRSRHSEGAPVSRSAASLLIDVARRRGVAGDLLTRQQLAQLHVLGEIGRYNTERLKATRARGDDIPGMANLSKLAMSQIVRLQRDLGLEILGALGMLHAYDEEQQRQLDAATGDPTLALVTLPALYAQAPSIYGGTDQIQRNIIGERALGLPKEPSADKGVPFSDLPKNG